MELLSVWLSTLMLFSCVVGTLSCSCWPQTLGKYICDADFAVKARVSNWTVDNTDDVNSRSRFTLHIVKIYKAPHFMMNEKEFHVSSNVADGLCGMNPGRPDPYIRRRPNQKIFITGSLKDGELWSYLCENTYSVWRNLSKSEKRTIKRSRNRTCL